jgi:hypothetical protein
VLADQRDEWAVARRYLAESSVAALTAPRETREPQAAIQA